MLAWLLNGRFDAPTGIAKRPILKPWKVATDCYNLRTGADRQCEELKKSGRHHDGRLHAVCQGADTKATQSYPVEVVRAINMAHAQDIGKSLHTLDYYS